MGWQATRSVAANFPAKETLLLSCVGLVPHLEERGASLSSSSATGPIVFALCATALAWNLTDVALLIAVGFGGFLRTMEALTLQRFQITAHNSFILLTLPATKTGKRTGETRSVIVDDPLLVSII